MAKKLNLGTLQNRRRSAAGGASYGVPVWQPSHSTLGGRRRHGGRPCRNVRIGGSNFSDTPDTHEIESKIAHSRVKLGPQAKKGARENHGGGQAGPRKDVED